jgi:Gluconate 2-dehydrogenase subunit 3
MQWSRRKFLGASAAAPIVAPVALDLLTTIEAAPEKTASSGALSEPERNLLRAAMDEIIPASDGMPGASEAGGLQYLNRITAEDAEVAGDIRGALAALDKCSGQLFQKRFDQLEREAKVSALTRLETAAPIEFTKLRDYIYEAYYTQPGVWKLIGYKFYPTDHPGPHMKPFDESILEEVRKRPKLYREA